MNRSTHFKLGIVGVLITTLTIVSCGGSDEPFTLVAAGDIAQCGIATQKIRLPTKRLHWLIAYSNKQDKIQPC